MQCGVLNCCGCGPVALRRNCMLSGTVSSGLLLSTPLRNRVSPIPAVDQVARWIELQDGRRLLGAGLAARAMSDPDVVLRVDGNADDIAEHVVVRHLLRPERIDLIGRDDSG